VQKIFPTLAVLESASYLHIGRVVSDREKDIKNLENTHPDIAKQQWVLSKNEWRHSLNGRIDGGWFRISNLGDKIQRLYGANTKIGREMADTLLNTIRENLMDRNEHRKRLVFFFLNRYND
jgi:hypothetical protein